MNPNNHQRSLFRLLDPLVDDLLGVSDKEILAELEEDGQDPAAVVALVKADVAAALRQAGKARFAQAGASLKAARQAPNRLHVVGLSFNEKERILKQFAADDRPLQERLTMAARNGQGMTEHEVDEVLQDLVDLGALDPDGNIL
jgi:hypothetical protein